MEKECTVEIVWQKEQCDRCNRITGSYYEGFVQVRADERLPSQFEIQTARSIATQWKIHFWQEASAYRTSPR